MANTYIYNLTDTWSNASTQYTGIGLNVIDSGSTANSYLFNFSVGGTSRVNVNKSGVMYLSNTLSVNTTNTSYALSVRGEVVISNSSTGNVVYIGANGNLGIGANTPTYKIDNRGMIRTFGSRHDIITAITPTVTTSASGGTVPAGTYYFKITSLDRDSNQTIGGVEVSNTTTGSTSTLTLGWTPPTGSPTSYRVWIGTAANTYPSYFAVTSNTLTITALTGNTAGTIPVHEGTGSSYIIGPLGVGSAPVTTSKILMSATDSSTGSYNAIRPSVLISNVSISANTNKTGFFGTFENRSQGKNANGTAYTTTVAGIQQIVYNGSSTTGGDGFLGTAYGILGQVQNWANGTSANSITNAYGALYQISPVNGPMLNAYGSATQILQANSTYANITAAFATYSSIIANTTGGSSITTGYLYYGSYTAALPANAYGVYVSGEPKNYFSGNVGIGLTNPTAKLHVSGNATVTSNTLLLGTSSIAASTNGYTWLPNNIKLNFGSVQANSSTGDATFNSAFGTACLSVVVTGLSGTANGAYVSGSPNTTVASIRTPSGTAANVSYIAIGI